MKLKIWVGKRESDILTYNYFDISITFWGCNTNRNHSYCTTERLKHNWNNEFIQFVIEHLLFYISRNQNKNVEIHFYNNSLAYKIMNLQPSLKEYIVNTNSQRVFNIVRHKTLSRLWLQNSTSVPQFAYFAKPECQYNMLLKKFPGYNKFVIQKSFSGGGDGTYLICADNWEKIIYSLDNDDVFLVSPYYEDNISLSCHIIVDNKNITVFPISIQLLNHTDNKICYCGNSYLNKNEQLSTITKKAAHVIGYQLMNICYRGICGLDFIFSNNKLMLIEINPRYQGSSYVINNELKKIKLPSLFELNNIAFNNFIDERITKQIELMDISCESHICFYKEAFTKNQINFPQDAQLFLDGLLNTKNYEDGVYLYRYITDKSDCI